MDRDIEARLSTLEDEVRSLRTRLDMLMGGLAVLVVLGQLALGAWLSAVIR
jgi:hypothetical protein